MKSNATVPNTSLPCADASLTCQGIVIAWRVLAAVNVYPDVVLAFVVPHTTKLTGGELADQGTSLEKEGEYTKHGSLSVAKTYHHHYRCKGVLQRYI